MRKIVLAILSMGVSVSYAQIGISTNDPKATLEVKGRPAESTTADGVIAPRMSRAELIAKTAYTSSQTGAIIYVTDLSGSTGVSTANVIETGYYYFNGSTWNSMNANVKFNYGDIKTGIQTSDHNGWIKLDGRAKNTLNAQQQSRATALGLGSNIPNASNSFLVQNGTTLGSVSSSNTKTIAQNQLPNVTLNGRIGASDGNVQMVSASVLAMKEAQSNWTNTADRYTGYGVVQVPLNGGVTQQNFDVTPQSLSVNTFIYLGE
jgi:hypothetical protein